MLVTEARERVGGNITTAANEAEGTLWEEGPNSFQPNDFILQAAVGGWVGGLHACSVHAASRGLRPGLQATRGVPRRARLSPPPAPTPAHLVTHPLLSSRTLASPLPRLPLKLPCWQMDAGVADQLVLGDPTAPRFVYWDKQLRPTPSGAPCMVERPALLAAGGGWGCELVAPAASRSAAPAVPRASPLHPGHSAPPPQAPTCSPST